MGVKGLKSLINDIYEAENLKRKEKNKGRLIAIERLRMNDFSNEEEKEKIIKVSKKEELDLLNIKKDISVLKGKRLSIDLSLLLHRALHKADQDETSSIYKYFIAIIILLKKHNIAPVFVFDGKPPDSKNILLEKRRNKREKANNKIKILNKLKEHISDSSSTDIGSILEQSVEEDDDLESSNISLDDAEVEYVNSILSDSIKSDNGIEDIEKTIDENLQKEGKKGVGIKDRHISKLKELFNTLKIPYIHIEDKEADIVCTYLVTQGYVDGCISDDMDLLAYGCPILVQNLNFTSNFVDVYDFDELLTTMDITQKQLIDLCICAGTDHNNKLINIKCKELYTYIKKYKTIEEIIDNLDEINREREVIMRNKGLIIDEYKSIKIPFKFKYQESRNNFTGIVEDLKDKLINYDDSEEDYLYIYETVCLENVEEFNEMIEFVFKNTSGWSKNQIRSKLAKILYKKYNKHQYSILNSGDNIKYTCSKLDDISIAVNRLTKKQTPNHKYNPNGRFRSLSKKKKRRQNHLPIDVNYRIFEHNAKPINIFNVLNVEA